MPNHVIQRCAIRIPFAELSSVFSQRSDDKALGPLLIDAIDNKSIATVTDFLTSSQIDHNLVVPQPEDIGNDWYNWCCSNWGSKWGWYDGQTFADNGLITEFTTNSAWSPSKKLWKKLASMFPQMQALVAVFDEGWCFAELAVISNGDVTWHQVEANSNMYELCYGDVAIEYNDETDTEVECESHGITLRDLVNKWESLDDFVNKMAKPKAIEMQVA